MSDPYLLTVCTGTVSGKPARIIAILHSMARWDPGARTVPTTRSPIACNNFFLSDLSARNKQL